MSTGEEGSESAGQVAEREPPPIEFLRNSAHTAVCNIMLSFSRIYYIVRLTVADFIHLSANLFISAPNNYNKLF